MGCILLFLMPLFACMGCVSTSASKKLFIEAKPFEGRVVSAEALPEQKDPSGPNDGHKGKVFVKPEPINSKLTMAPEAAIRKANEEAARNPDSDGFFNSAMTFDWEPGSLYQIYTAPLHVTDISFETGEEILSISGGDTTRWQVQQTTSGTGIAKQNHVLIKPSRSGLKTNLVIMTERRAYHLEIHSLPDGAYMASVLWNYPKPMILVEREVDDDLSNTTSIEQLTPENLNFKYHFVAEKKPSWMPMRVFDDGQKTFIEFPKSVKAREMPGLFVLSDGGDTEIVNYRASGSFYIIDRLIDLVELRLGSEDAEIVGIERL